MAIEKRQGKHEMSNSEWEIIKLKLKFCQVNQGEISNRPKQYILFYILKSMNLTECSNTFSHSEVIMR